MHRMCLGWNSSGVSAHLLTAESPWRKPGDFESFPGAFSLPADCCRRIRGSGRYLVCFPWVDTHGHEPVSKPSENLGGIRFSCGFAYRQFVPKGF